MSAIDFDKDRERRTSAMFEQMAEHFFRRWAPADEENGAEFHAEFFALVQRIHLEAGEPYRKLFEQFARAMPPMFPIITPPTPRGEGET